MELMVATYNKSKLKEIKELLKGIRSIKKVCSLSDLSDQIKIIENGNSFFQNAVIKARTTVEFLDNDGFVLAEDSGICVDALRGKPGIYSSRFAGEGASDQENNEKLLLDLKEIISEERTAQYVCSLVLFKNGELIFGTEARCSGSISVEPFGSEGFGYDPLFVPDGFNETFGQLGMKVKQTISHRSKALQRFKEFVKNYLE